MVEVYSTLGFSFVKHHVRERNDFCPLPDVTVSSRGAGGWQQARTATGDRVELSPFWQGFSRHRMLLLPTHA